MPKWLTPSRSGQIYRNAAGRVYTGTAGVPVFFEDADVSGAIVDGWSYATQQTPDPQGALIPLLPSLITNPLTGGNALTAGGKSFQFGSYDSIITSKLPKFKAAIAKVRANTASAKVLFVGDSTWAGAFASGVGWAGNKPLAVPAQVAQYATAAGLQVNLGNVVGSTTNTGTSIANLLAYDARLAAGANWTVNAVTTAGGGSINNNGAGNYTPLNFTPTEAWDTVEITYIQNTSYGSFTVSVNGGAAIGATVASAGALSLQKVTRSTTLGVQTLNINKVADGNVIILAIRTYRAATQAVEIINAGWGGSKAADWAANVNIWDPIGGINSIAPDLTIINLTINDWIAATTPSAVVTSTQTIIAAARNSGDVILCTGFPSATGSASKANQDALIQAIRPVAINYGIPLLDFSAYWGDYTTAAANGYFLPANDPVHPGSAGYGNAAYAIGTIFGSA